MRLGDNPLEEERRRDLEDFEQWDKLRRGVLCRASLQYVESNYL